MSPTCGRGNSLVIIEVRGIYLSHLWTANWSEPAGLVGTMSTEECYQFLPATSST